MAISAGLAAGYAQSRGLHTAASDGGNARGGAGQALHAWETDLMEERLDLPAAELQAGTTALGRVMRPLAHQLCNDLAYVTSTCDLALLSVTDAEATALLQGAAGYVQGVCDSLRGFSRMLQTPPTEVQAVPLALLVALAREKGAVLATPALPEGDATLACAPDDLALGLAALLANAAEAGATHIGVQAWAEGPRQVLEVRDDGRGFPAGRLAERSEEHTPELQSH